MWGNTKHFVDLINSPKPCFNGPKTFKIWVCSSIHLHENSLGMRRLSEEEKNAKMHLLFQILKFVDNFFKEFASMYF